jgi:hypothetical protein
MPVSDLRVHLCVSPGTGCDQGKYINTASTPSKESLDKRNGKVVEIHTTWPDRKRLVVLKTTPRHSHDNSYMSALIITILS